MKSIQFRITGFSGLYNSLSFQEEANLYEFSADAELGSAVYRRDDSQTGQTELWKTEKHGGKFGDCCSKAVPELC